MMYHKERWQEGVFDDSCVGGFGCVVKEYCQ